MLRYRNLLLGVFTATVAVAGVATGVWWPVAAGLGCFSLAFIAVGYRDLRGTGQSDES